jgi:hypothetical protein
MKNDIYLQYKGFIKTPNLWQNNDVKNVNQFQVFDTLFQLGNPEIFNEIRLGKRVEQFLNFQISKTPNCKLLAKNIQIRIEKQTIGELDALVLLNGKAIHIETVYKFYLYDETIESENSLNKWIGPNRNDNFTYKITKLKEKQLPLLYHNATLEALVSLNLDPKTIQQNVCFRAQLFLPYKTQNLEVSPFSKAAVYGFYISCENLEKLESYQFYIPRKLDWLTEPHNAVDWLNFEFLKSNLTSFMIQKRSPMVWLKFKNEKLLKCFITWW